MPIYEYECPKCGVFEVEQRISESALKVCPQCDAQVERIISASAFHLKGGGWYKSDYSAKKSPSTDSVTPKSEGSSDAAPAKTESSDKSEKNSLKTAPSCGTGCGCGKK